MATYPSYHEIVGNYYDKSNLIEEIRKCDVQNLLLVVAMLNNTTSINSSLIRDDFVEYLAYLYPKSPVRNVLSRSDVLFHPQGLLNTAKWLIAYGDFSKSEPIFSQNGNMYQYVRQVIKLCLIISDFMDQRETDEVSFDQLQSDLLRNGNFNNKSDIASQTARTLYLLDDLSVISESSGFDYKSLFKSKYNYTIREYIALLFVIYSIYLTREKNMSAFNIDTFFGNTLLADRGRAFFNLLVCTPSDIKDWALSTLDSPWEFRGFWRKPLLQLPCGRIHPMLPSILLSNLYIDLEIKICQLFVNSKRAEVKSQLGRQFEKYTCDLAAESFGNARYVSQVFPEFPYGPNKSPDYMVLFEDKLIVIEAKSLRPLADFAFQDDLEPIQNGVKKLIIDPMNQTLERVGELMSRDLWNGHPRPNISEVYIMVVTIVGITSWEPNETFIHSTLSIPSNVPLMGHFHVDIHEFELLCELAERKHAKPLIHYLNRNNPQQVPFSQHLYKENLHPRRPNRLKKLYKEKSELIRRTIFY